MVSLKQKNQKGFTIVELLIVIVIIGILAGLVVTQFIGANQSARDSERKTDVNSMASQLEVYRSKTGGYPTRADLENPTWRQGNDVNAGDQGKALIAPNGGDTTVLADGDGTNKEYGYVALKDDGTSSCDQSPTDENGESNDLFESCSSFTFSALFENKKDASLNDAGFYIKKSAE